MQVLNNTVIIVLEDHSLICFEASCLYQLSAQVGVDGLKYKNLPFRKDGHKTQVKTQTISLPDSSFNGYSDCPTGVAVN